MIKSTTSARRRVVHDTDAFNEIDDQYALAHLLLSPEQVDLEAAYAAPFYLPELNSRATSPGDGMAKSYQEILHVIDLVGRRPVGGAFRGSESYLPSEDTPVDSPAARDLIARGLASTSQDPLYVCSTGAITNVASALLLEPKIAENIVIVWLGGHAFYWPHNREFNLMEDVHAARVVLKSRARLIHIPCLPISSHLMTTVAELRTELAPYSKIGAYLTNILRDFEKNDGLGYAKPIWDIAASAYIVNSGWLPTVATPAPVLKNDLTWGVRKNGGRKIDAVQWINRNAIFRDFFQKTREFAQPGATSESITFPKWTPMPGAYDEAARRVMLASRKKSGPVHPRNRTSVVPG